MYSKNIWQSADENKVKTIFDFNEDYKKFLSYGKTERLCVEEAIKEAEAQGYKNIKTFKSLKAGDKVYATNKGKNFAIFKIGKKPLEDGLRVLGAHIDSPRMDLKQNPLYEKMDFAMMDTHYYGGIKKYQWVTIPLALHGVVYKKDGSCVNVNIGEDLSDPVLGINDLLIHLSADQLQLPASKAIEGENLDLTVGNIPLMDKEKEAVKGNILKLLKFHPKSLSVISISTKSKLFLLNLLSVREYVIAS